MYLFTKPESDQTIDIKLDFGSMQVRIRELKRNQIRKFLFPLFNLGNDGMIARIRIKDSIG